MRINVERKKRTQYFSRGPDRERAVAAAELDSVTTYVAKTKGV